MNKFIKTVIAAIKAGRFNYENYASRRAYRGVDIITQPLFCSYGQIGYNVFIYDHRGSHVHTISYDWEIKKITVDDKPEVEWLAESKADEFIDRLKKLCKEYNASIYTVGVEVDGNSLDEWKSEAEISDDDVFVIDGENL